MNVIADILDSDISDDSAIIIRDLKHYTKLLVRHIECQTSEQIDDVVRWEVENWLLARSNGFRLQDFWIQPNYSENHMWVALDIWSRVTQQLQKLRFKADKPVNTFYS